MYQNVIIESLDSFGRGVSHINNKVIFIPNALPEEIVDIKIVSEHKNYCEGKVLAHQVKSNKRIDSLCPYFSQCGGCQLLFYKYLDTIDYKLKKVKDLFQKNKIAISKIDIVSNPHPFNYRNKISLKILNNKIGFYEEKTHNLVEINECLIANSTINEVIKNYK